LVNSSRRKDKDTICPGAIKLVAVSPVETTEMAEALGGRGRVAHNVHKAVEDNNHLTWKKFSSAAKTN
jgi:hypothetical protein